MTAILERRESTSLWGRFCNWKKYGIPEPTVTGSSQVSYPANTNILYVDLQAVEEVGSCKNASCLPGMVLNLKKAVSYVDHLGFECRYFPLHDLKLPTFLYAH